MGSELLVVGGAWLADKFFGGAISDAGKRFLASVVDADVGGNLKAINGKVAAAVGDAPTQPLPAGLTMKILEDARFVDEPALQDAWANLLARGLLGEVSAADVRWAAGELSTLGPEAAVALAAIHAQRFAVVRHEDFGPEAMVLARAMRHLWARDLVQEGGPGGKVWLLGPGRGQAPSRNGPLDPSWWRKSAEARGDCDLLLLEPGTGANGLFEIEAFRLRLSAKGEELSRIAGVEPLPTYYGYDDALVPFERAVDWAYEIARAQVR